MSIYARSWLFTPAMRPERFANAAKNGVDVLIVDLEDAVQPDLKAVARDNARRLLDAPLDGTLPALGVRINAPSSRAGLDDLAMLDEATAAHFVLIPKVESAEVVAHVARLFEEAGKNSALIPMIESARGLAVVRTIAKANPRIAGLMFLAGDYASDVSAQPDSLALQLARVQIASACAEADVLAIDAPCFALHDPALLRADLAFAFANGFAAKAAIHPSHVAAINETFMPSAERIAWARQVIAASERGTGIVDGQMVDEAIAREARRVLARRPALKSDQTLG